MDDTRTWFHCTTHTYGAWLRGDPRGFRTRHHREHVEGDYKNPPPAGKYDDLYQLSKRLLKQEPVVLTPDWRRIVGEALRDRMLELGAELISISVSGQHVHLQARMPTAEPRHWVGVAKLHAWFVARDHGWATKMWAKRSKATPIKNRAHQVNVFWYILRHAKEGAWVWHYRMGLPPAGESPPAAAGGLSPSDPR